MTSRVHNEQTARPGRRGRVFNLARFALLALLLATLVAQSLFLWKDSWEVPRPVLARLHQKLDEQGLQLTYESLAFRPPATLTVIEPRVSRVGETEPLAEADIGQLEFSLPELLQGKIAINKGTLYGGTVFCPAEISPTGKRETVVQKIHAVVSHEGGSLRIHNLNGMLNNLAFTASGEIPVAAPEEEDVEPTDWEREVGIVLSRLVQEREMMNRARRPHVRLSFLSEEEAGFRIAVEGWAESIDGPFDLAVSRPHFTVSATFDGTDWRGDRAGIDIAEVAWNSRITARTLRGSARWKANGDATTLLPQQAEIAFAQIDGAAESWRDVRAQFSIADARRIAIDLFAFFGNEPLEGKARLDLEKGDGQLQLLSRLNPTALFASDLANDFDLPFEISFQETPFARASAWMKDWKFVRAAGRAHARQTNIDGVFFHQATARVELYPDRFVVPEMKLAYGDFKARGSYEVNFDDFSYRLLFAGDVRPLHIRAWFRDWWVGLWERFDFPRRPLRGDVDIHGRHGHGEQTKLFGAVQAEDFSLSGVGFERFASRLTVTDNRVRLFDIAATRPEGAATGWFQYEVDPEGGDMKQLNFEAHSTLDPLEIARIFGEDGTALFSPFQFTEPPALLLGGTLYGPARRDENRITVTGRSSAPLMYHDLALDHLLVDLLIEDNAWTLRRLDAGVAGGEVSGDASKWEQDGEERLSFSLILLDLDLPVLLQAVSTWRAGMGLEGANHPAPENVGGILDAAIQAEGIPGDFQSFKGAGSLDIRDANLAEIHLLGLLSRILSATPLRFTSLHFTDAEATFQLERDTLHFPTLVLTGPSAEIQASGDYQFDKEALDFSLKLHILRQSRIPFLPVILSPLLEPLAHVLEIELTGPVSDPEWRFLLGPSNILKGITGGGNEGSTDESD